PPVNPLVHIALGNALVAAVLGILVAGISRVCRRPALVHGLWVLVLVKLVTPSFVEYRMPWPDRPEQTVGKLGLASPRLASPKVPTAPSGADGAERALPRADAGETPLFPEPPVSSAEVSLVVETSGAHSLRGQATPVAAPHSGGSDLVSAGRAPLSW